MEKIVGTNIDTAILDNQFTLTNFSNSILKHFGLAPFHSTIETVDKVMRGHKKIAAFLFDGASEYNLNLYPKTSRFLLNHKLMTIHSVNPATTVSCTTAFLSARFPIETGWLGWSLNFKDIGPIDAFSGKSSYGEKNYGASLMKDAAPYTNIISLLNEAHVKAKAFYEFPVENKEGPKNFRSALKKYSAFFEGGGEFLYGYFKNPDKTLHDKGVKSIPTWWQFYRISWFLRRFTKQNPDVLVFAFADHGLINVSYKDLSDYPDIETTLRYPISLDARIPTFFVKQGMEKAFESAFEKHLSSDFILVKKEDILKMNYFGDGKIADASDHFIGDYVGIAKDNIVLKQYGGKKKEKPLKAHHSGPSKEEREILLSVYNV